MIHLQTFAGLDITETLREFEDLYTRGKSVLPSDVQWLVKLIRHVMTTAVSLEREDSYPTRSHPNIFSVALKLHMIAVGSYAGWNETTTIRDYTWLKKRLAEWKPTIHT